MKYKIETDIYKQIDRNDSYLTKGYGLYEKKFIFWKFVKFSISITELIDYINKNN